MLISLPSCSRYAYSPIMFRQTIQKIDDDIVLPSWNDLTMLYVVIQQNHGYLIIWLNIDLDISL